MKLQKWKFWKWKWKMVLDKVVRNPLRNFKNTKENIYLNLK